MNTEIGASRYGGSPENPDQDVARQDEHRGRGEPATGPSGRKSNGNQSVPPLEIMCAYGDPNCPCTVGAACNYEWSMGTPPTPHPKHAYRRPKGECSYCDRNRNDPMMPPHTASKNCESGKRPHCTCDTCY